MFYCQRCNGDDLYTLNEFKSYEKTVGMQVQNKLLIIIVSELISESYKRLTDVGETGLSNIKKWNTIWSNTHIKSCYPHLVGALTRKQIMDDYFDQIHYKNGY
jgi:hypothetical protein